MDSKKRSLIEWMRFNSMDEYGAVILGEDLREFLGIEYPETGTKQEFDAIQLQELASVDSAKTVLLKEGKYLARVSGDYRILLPSENARQVESYMRSAQKKLERATTLSCNTPATVHDEITNKANRDTRLHMQSESLKLDTKRMRILGNNNKNGKNNEEQPQT